MLGKKKLWQNRIIDVLAVGQKLKWVRSSMLLICSVQVMCVNSKYTDTKVSSGKYLCIVHIAK